MYGRLHQLDVNFESGLVWIESCGDFTSFLLQSTISIIIIVGTILSLDKGCEDQRVGRGSGVSLAILRLGSICYGNAQVKQELLTMSGSIDTGTVVTNRLPYFYPSPLYPQKYSSFDCPNARASVSPTSSSCPLFSKFSNTSICVILLPQRSPHSAPHHPMASTLPKVLTTIAYDDNQRSRGFRLSLSLALVHQSLHNSVGALGRGEVGREPPFCIGSPDDAALASHFPPCSPPSHTVPRRGGKRA
ncbi:hypothetical protein RRG08_038106 [Elysia crispata]|uniref:Uncharacterized protein n=1 Tax=Elysia crispata TaxID=231223 RepID=A0AAE0ZYE4_9GAST|nr:hypothetical protein RRG08_038106 [Elysia crispata]